MNRFLRIIDRLGYAGLLGLLVIVLAVCGYIDSHAAIGGGIMVSGVVFARDEMIRYLVAAGLLDAQGGLLKRVVVKTANYTIVAPTSTLGDASGTIFTNRGAGAGVTFTLPAPSMALQGCVYEFVGIADFSITIATATADTMIVTNDIAADSLAASTATKLIGAVMRAVCDGTSWIVNGTAVGSAGTAVTYTVAT